ncbi:hypothetical protein [Ramlibacter sp.]|uniref:hypothetical protein n=1 Tax=Ramlibacter sp. TaxID=1917967 RepID=UPI003D12284D
MTDSKLLTFAGLALAASLSMSPAFAEKGGHGHGNGHGHDKAEKHAQKHADKAEKHARKQFEKAQKRADKQAERAWKDDRRAHAHAAPAARRDDRRRQDIRVGTFFNDRHRTVVRNYYVTNYPVGKSCPPGLAKKHNGCLPPGHAKRLALGQPVPAGVTYYTVPQPVLVQLPPVPYGYRYVRVGNDIALLSPQTALVVDLIGGLLG